MASFAPMVDVEDLAGRERGQHLRRVAGHLEDMRTVAIASMVAGDERASIEMTFTLDEAHELALAALSGDRRALTSPGIARKLSATVAILFRVCLAANGLQRMGVPDDDGRDGHHGDRSAPAGAEPARDPVVRGG